jgi:glycosyltransferase involved in cell wall biosynthesis
MYSGNIGVSHYFADILQVARRLQNRSELLFAFVGNGRRRPEIETFKAQHQLANIELLPFQPQNKLVQSLGAGDLHFICLRPGFTGLVVPSKIYGVLAAGRPILFQGEKEGEIARLIDEEDVGRVVTPGDEAGLEKAILAYLNDPALTRRQGENGRRLAEGRYSIQEAQSAYTALLSPVGLAAESDQGIQDNLMPTRPIISEE